MPEGRRAAPGYALTQTAERFGVPVSDPHDALDDALVTAQLFLVLAGRLPRAADAHRARADRARTPP